MEYIREFAAQYVCEPPAGLPAELEERLEFLSCLAEKRTRSVYLCHDRRTGGKAVLKVTRAGSPDNIAREYALLGKLDHPAIPKAYAFCRDGGAEYLLRSYAEGDTLDRLVERDGVFGERETLVIIQKLCVILSHLHHREPPIIFRDIKPQNIVLTPNGRLSLIDFGISREQAEDKEFDTIYLGSVAFAAPEQFGFTKTDSRSDVFALGKLMLYLSSGQTKLPALRQAVESKRLVRLIARCTALSPEKRFASVDRLDRVIGRLLNPPTRTELLAGGLAAVLVAGVGIPAVFWGGGQEEPPPEQPVSAQGRGYEEELQIPVRVETTLDGKPFSGCAVAADNHHWFQPDRSGRAELLVYAYDNYKIQASLGNRTASIPISVTREDEALSFALELGGLPQAPDLLQVDLEWGAVHQVALPVSGAEEITLSGQPEWITVTRQGGEFSLAVDGAMALPGHYTFFLDAVNQDGKAETVLALNLEAREPATPIRTASELAAIADRLDGRYVLENDLDLSGAGDWTPIGDAHKPFTGVFDGGGHTITGLSFDGPWGNAGLFGVVERGVIRGVIVEGAEISAYAAGGDGFGIVAGNLNQGLIEHCAVLGGSIRANIGMESAAGGIVGVNGGVVRGCFNSASVTIFTAGSKDRTETYAGGVCGYNNGYLENSGNIGAVTGISIAGGVAGFNDTGILTRCYNGGRVQAPVFVGSYPAGSVAHLLGRGRRTTYCAFERGTAGVGTTVFNGGVVVGLVPLNREEFADLDRLGEVFGQGDLAERWEYRDQVPGYPIPRGILS